GGGAVSGTGGDPRTLLVQRPQIDCPWPKAFAPISSGRLRTRWLTGRVHHELKQLVFGPDVSVERHGRHVELFGDLGQGRRLEAPLIGELNGGGHHGFDIEGGLSPPLLRSLRQPPQSPDEVRNRVVAPALSLAGRSGSNSTSPCSLRDIVCVILSSACLREPIPQRPCRRGECMMSTP